MTAIGLERVQRKIRESGLRFTILLACRRVIPEHWISVNRIYVFAEDLAGEIPVTQVAGDEVRWASEADADLLTPFGIAPEFVCRRLRAGMRLIILLRAGSIAGFNWYDPQDHDEFGWLQYVLTPGDIWAFDGQVLPQHRGSGVFGAMRNHAAASLKQQGYKRVLSQVEALNRAAIKARRKTSAKVLMHYRYFRCFGVSLVIDRGALRVGSWRTSKPYRMTFS